MTKRKPVKRLYDYLEGKSLSMEDVVEMADEEIQPLLRDLNRAGYRTSYSCGGGSGHDHPIGWIDIIVPFRLGKEDLEEIAGIVEQNTNVPFHFFLEHRNRKLTIIFRGPISEEPIPWGEEWGESPFEVAFEELEGGEEEGSEDPKEITRKYIERESFWTK